MTCASAAVTDWRPSVDGLGSRARGRCRLRAGLGGLDDGVVHAVGDLRGEAEVGVDEPGSGQPVEVLTPRQPAGDAADLAAALGPLGRGDVVLGDDVGDPDPSAGRQHPEHLGDHLGLVDD